MKAVLYIRVSTVTQAIDGYSIDMQKRTLSEWCESHNAEIVAVYADEGISGKDVNHRPQMQKMLNHIETGKIDMLVIWALSRLTRSVSDLYSIWQICEKHNTDIISITEPFDTSIPIGRAMMGILGVFAQMERELTAERVSAAMLERAMQGKRTAHSIIGYDQLGTDSYVVNPDEAEVVRYIFDKFIQHKCISAVAELCNNCGYRGKRGQEFRCESIKKIIRNPVYIGYNRFKGSVYKGEHEPIIAENVFRKANKILDNISYKKGGV